MGVKIQALEYYFPENKVSNEMLRERFPDYDFTKFESKVGIMSRYWVDSNETALDLAEQACLKLFENIDRTQVEYIVYCTQSPEYILPTTACLLQERLGLSRTVGAFDFNLGCSGYVYGLSLAKGLIESGQVNNVLLVTAETYSKYLNEEDRSNRAIFGDAATATFLIKSNREGLKQFAFGSDGSGAEKLIIKNGGTKNSCILNPETKVYGSDNQYTDNNLYMNGPEIFNFTAENIPDFTKKVLEINKMELQNPDYFIFHQANSFMLEFLRKRIKIEKEKFYINMADGGNTVSNTIPIALKRLANDLGNIAAPLSVVVVGFGVGLSWAGGIIEIDNSLI
ncbi:3-oxoacyl-ACP synthase III family protein [Sphingobacterium siyangense]|uniref:3-oxoacyl-[acyl-carrier-protein] synthase-3 n=1 Tax=Sphingobacterium siyangense TaxID=459529 RepID=A0A562MJF2_9SPHI|nr:ketoacyl-ACP synthase III [Sphingobacterium siyangense]TWI19968.1 3-oxoacyl-[acyl-carrier-protein] synthase-3 [Sphingobacterium siyangense]